MKGILAQETPKSFENIRAIVEVAEGTIADIVQCTIYVSDVAHWLFAYSYLDCI